MASPTVATGTGVALSPAAIAESTGFPYHQLNLKVELLVNTTWTDITQYVMTRDDILISPLGRTDETSEMQTGSMTLTLKNTDGRFTPENANGAYYPYVQLNSQMRLSINDISVNGTTYSGYRFWGEVSEWPPVWDNSGRDVSMPVTVSGIWRRISQSTDTTTIGSPYTRWNTQLGSGYTVAGYWPMEDGTYSTTFAAVEPSSASAMTIIATNGAPTLSSCTAFPGSDALPQLNGAELSGLMSTSDSPTQIMFRFCLFVQSGGDTGSGASTIARLHLGTNASLNYVDVSLAAAGGGPFTITGYNSSGVAKFTGTLTQSIWGIPILCQVGLVESGSSVIWSFNTILPNTSTWYGTVTGTAASMSLADASSVIFSPGAAFKGVSVGQAMVLYGNPSITSDANALGGWDGENALTRFERLCTEESIPYESIGTTTTNLGPQIDDTLANILQEIEYTDNGQMYETRDKFGLGYRTMASLQNQSVALTLNYAAAQLDPSLAPVNDDSLVRNDVTLTNYDGYSVRVYLANGARSLNAPPNGVGSGYEYTQNVNSASDTQVNAVAEQILNCGCTSENRYPTITVNLARVTTASLFHSAPSVRIGDYVQITNMPSFMGGGTEKQLIWGWNETITNTGRVWTIAYNTIPELPWESGFNPGTLVTGQVPSSPTTSSQSGTVSGAQIAEGAIIGSNIASGTVQGGNIALGTITAANIGTATITGANIATGTIEGTNIDSATISGSNIANATISGSNIANGAITATQIASATITSAQISTSAGITGSQIGSGTITASNIASATITSSQISTAAGITGSQIAGGTITAANITSATITNVQIAAGSITGSNINSGTITGANLQNATITSVQISNGTITTTQISNSANITGTQIASGTIAAANIAANTITAGNIAAGAITTTQIAANTIAAGNIAAGAITTATINAGAVTAAKIASGTITGTQIAASISLTSPVITGGMITGGTLVADGSSGELLVYSSTPASGNLVMSASAVSGTDAYSNSYNAGISLYNSTTKYTTLTASVAGNLVLGTGSGGGGGLEMVTQPGTPASANSIFYADATGSAAYRNGPSGYNGQLVNSISGVPGANSAHSGTPTAVTPTFTIPANDPAPGTLYRLKAWGYGTYSSGTNTWWELYVAGNSQAEAAATSLPSTFMWELEADLAFATIGSSGTAYVKNRVMVATIGSPDVSTNATPSMMIGMTGSPTASTISVNTTTSMSLVVNCAGTTFSIVGIGATLERIGP